MQVGVDAAGVRGKDGVKGQAEVGGGGVAKRCRAQERSCAEGWGGGRKGRGGRGGLEKSMEIASTGPRRDLDGDQKDAPGKC